jgi:hypothetical protein
MARIGRLPAEKERDTVDRPSKRKQRQKSNASSAVEHADELDQCCAQAIAIAALLTEADTDQAIQDSAWAILCLIERVRNNGDSLFQLARRPK